MFYTEHPLTVMLWWTDQFVGFYLLSCSLFNIICQLESMQLFWVPHKGHILINSWIMFIHNSVLHYRPNVFKKFLLSPVISPKFFLRQSVVKHKLKRLRRKKLILTQGPSTRQGHRFRKMCTFPYKLANDCKLPTELTCNKYGALGTLGVWDSKAAPFASLVSLHWINA